MTTSFRDNKSRSWTIEITIGSAKRVRDACGVNLLQIIDNPDSLNGLATDPITFVDVLYVLVKPQADAANITDIDFGESLGGDAIENATSAFLEALIGFFPPARRAVLQKVVDRATAKMEQSTKDLLHLVESGKLDAEIDKAIASTNSTESPAPPESTPAR